VLRSRNGVGFEEAGNVNATGFTTGATYTFNDPHPYSGINYYKLKLVDKSGTYKFSSIIKANLNSKDVNVLVYPTMVSDMLNYVVETPKAAKMTVQVNDISGKKITNTVEFFATGSTQRSIPVSNLASGMYLLTIADESTGFKKSIIFKKN
jgi:hypothetical protein